MHEVLMAIQYYVLPVASNFISVAALSGITVLDCFHVWNRIFPLKKGQAIAL